MSQNKIEAARIKAGHSYRHIADETGIPRSIVERIHKGQGQMVNRAHARKLHEFYKKRVPLADIYDPLFRLECG